MSSKIPKEIIKRIEKGESYLLKRVDQNTIAIKSLDDRVSRLEEKMDRHFEALIEDNRNNIIILLEGIDQKIDEKFDQKFDEKFDQKFDEKFDQKFHENFSREIRPITRLLMNHDRRIAKLESKKS